MTSPTPQIKKLERITAMTISVSNLADKLYKCIARVNKTTVVREMGLTEWPETGRICAPE